MELQQHGALPRGRRVIRWIASTFGAAWTRTLILGFAHQPCVFCSHGLVSCDRCTGKGHLDYAFLCEDCFGLGVRPCGFCNGTGWASWDFVPAELRLLVLAERTKAAVDSIRARQRQATPSEEKLSFLQSTQLLLAVNKDMGVLENTVTYSDKARPQSAREREMVHAMIDSMVEFAPLAQQQRLAAVKEMIDAVRALSLDASIEQQKRSFEKDRLQFYRAACEAEPPFEGTFLRHPLLENRVSPGSSPEGPGSTEGEPAVE